MVIFAVGVAVYVLWLTSSLSGLIGGGMQFVSVFLVTGISALLFPYRKRVRGIWEASPYHTWKIAGIPLVTIGGVLYLTFIVTFLYFSFIDPTSRDVTGKNLFVFAAAWVGRHDLVLRLALARRKAGHRPECHVRRAAA